MKTLSMDMLKKIKLSERDRRLVIILAVFLALAAYYQFIFEPVFRKWNSSFKVMSEKKKELRQMERKLREFRGIQRDREEFLSKIAIINARVNMPSSKKKLPDILRAIMVSADKSSVKINNLRPVATTEEGSETPVVNTFSVDGSAKINEVANFMERAWGMKIDELGLSLTDDKEKPVHFYMKLSLLAPIELETPRTSVKVVHFAFTEDPFRPREKAVVASRIMMKGRKGMSSSSVPSPSDIVPPPPEPTVNISGLRLVGITGSGSKKNAIVIDDSKAGEEFFLQKGDAFREYAVTEVDNKGVTFSLKEGASGRLEFPPQAGDIIESNGPPSASAAQKKTSSTKNGRLGINVMNLTPAIIREKGLSVQQGLIVTKGRADAPDINIDDVVVSINGIRTAAIGDAMKIMHTVKPGDELELGMLRGETVKTVKIKAIE